MNYAARPRCLSTNAAINCGVKRITELSGYSRASFYQYFSSKEDLFHQLTGRVARELSASTEVRLPGRTSSTSRKRLAKVQKTTTPSLLASSSRVQAGAAGGVSPVTGRIAGGAGEGVRR